MADIPRDPRQLARDILAGKIRIEDLAKERQMRAGGPPTGPRMPDKIPLPRPVQRPAANPTFPPRPQQRPTPPVRQNPQSRGPMGGQRPQPPRPVPPPIQKQPQITQREPQSFPEAPVIGTPEAPVVPKTAVRTLKIHQLARSKLALRQGILLAEVLGKPLSLRE